MFAAASGAYAPARHMEALLTFEQVFRRVTSIRTNHQDLHAARTLMFSTMDTFENLLGRNILNLCHPTQAARTLSRLRGTIPTAAQPVLLPAADRAVNAVAAVGAGFFLTDREDRIEVGDGNNPMTRRGRHGSSAQTAAQRDPWAWPPEGRREADGNVESAPLPTRRKSAIGPCPARPPLPAGTALGTCPAAKYSPIVSSGGGLRDRGETVRAMAGGSAFRNSED